MPSPARTAAQSETHSSQILTPDPRIKYLISVCALPQNEHSVLYPTPEAYEVPRSPALSASGG
jgi:hypothetical protein